MECLNLSKTELAALELFKDKLGDYLTDELDSYQRQDANLLRWLRARDLNVDKAEKMLKASMIWRRDNGIDKLLTWKRPAIFDNQAYPFMVPGFDRDDCVVSIVPFGRWDIRGAVEGGHRNDMIAFANQILEQGFAFMKKESNEKRTLTQFIIIFDWEGFSINQILSRETVEMMMECLRLFEANYPETLKEAYVVNAPAIFELVYNLLKPFVTAHTLGKVKIFGTKSEQWRAALMKNFDPIELPSRYGGSNNVCKNYDFADGLDRVPYPIDLPETSFKTASIAAGEKLVIDYHVDRPGIHLTWNYKTEQYDIGFQFRFEDQKLFACSRADSHLKTQKGYYKCDRAGTYKLCFDNSFSKFRSKTIHYAMEEGAPSPTKPIEKIDQLG